jgi:GDP-fucose transporter C1
VLKSADLPLTFLFFQLVIAVLCLQLWSVLQNTEWVAPRWNKKMVQKMVPVSAVNIVGLVFNIYCLKLVDAAYYQVARGLVLPMTIALQAFMPGGSKPSTMVLTCCGLVTWGFAYSFLPFPLGASNTVPEAPALGMILGVLSAAMIAVHAILIKTSLKHVDGSTLDLAYWTNILSVLAVVPAVVVSGEVGGFIRLVSGTEGDLHAFTVGSLVTVSSKRIGFADLPCSTDPQGIVGFLICVAGLLSIKITSPVTHMFSSAARSVLQALLGAKLFGDILNM